MESSELQVSNILRIFCREIDVRGFILCARKRGRNLFPSAVESRAFASNLVLAVMKVHTRSAYMAFSCISDWHTDPSVALKPVTD